MNYSDFIVPHIPRLIGLMDRNEFSPTYGCFDRDYWLYKSVDFVCADRQNIMLVLALLYKNKYSENKFYQKDFIKKWAIAAMLYTVKIAQKDGSYNEWYPNEHSFVSTAFVVYALSESYLVLQNELSNTQKNYIKKALIKSGKWLLKHNESVANQQSGALCAIYNIYLITNNPIFKRGAQKKFEILESMQSEGWFSEYGGPDIGYLSLLINYLSDYYEKSNNSNVLPVIDKAIDFIQYFIHPDNSSGGEYGSRNTEYLVPTGFARNANRNKIALSIAHSSLKRLSKGLVFDDRYLSYIGFLFLQAPSIKNIKQTSTTIHSQSFEKYFEKAGLFVKSNQKQYIIINLKKGGVIKIYNKDSLIFEDCGIIAKTKNKTITTQHLGSLEIIKGNNIQVKGSFYEEDFKTMNPLLTIASRIFQITFGKSNSISLYVKELLRKKLITNQKKSPLKFQRQFNFEKDKLTITDTIYSKGIKLRKVSIGGKFSFGAIPSARFFTGHSDSRELTREELFELNKENKLTIFRDVVFS